MDKLNDLISKACLASELGKKGITVDLQELSQVRDGFWALLKRAEAAETELAELAKQEPVGFIHRMVWSEFEEAVCTGGEHGKEMFEGLSNHFAVYTRPAPAAVPVDGVPDYFERLVSAARERAEEAMRKFPQPNYVLNKVAEESGEVIKAVIHYTEGREDWLSVEDELIDNLAMLYRLVTEGDGVIGFSPPEEVLRRIEQDRE